MSSPEKPTEEEANPSEQSVPDALVKDLIDTSELAEAIDTENLHEVLDVVPVAILITTVLDQQHRAFHPFTPRQTKISTKTLPALAWQLDAALNNPADQGPFLERRMRERHAYFARKQFSTRGDKAIERSPFAAGWRWMGSASAASFFCRLR